MIPKCIIVCGLEGSGKSQLVSCLAQTKKTYDPKHKKTTKVELSLAQLPEFNSIKIWDMTSDITNPDFKEWDDDAISLYCVDMSEQIDTNRIGEEIASLRISYPKMKIVLVGTKQDIAQPLAEQQLAIIATEELDLMLTSAKLGTGIVDLRDKLDIKLPLQINKTQTKAPKFSESNAISKLRDQFDVASEFHDILDNFYEVTQDLSPAIIEALAKEVLRFLIEISPAKNEDKIEIISAFTENSRIILQGKHHTAMSCIISLAATLTVAVIAGIVGFGIGFGLGLWSGPGAFLTGLIAGVGAGTAVVAGSSALGLSVGALCLYGLFKDTPALEAIDEIAEEAKKESDQLPDLEALNLNTLALKERR